MVCLTDVERYARDVLALSEKDRSSVDWNRDLHYGAQVFNFYYGDRKTCASFICGSISDMNAAATIAIEQDYADLISPRLVAEYARLDFDAGYDAVATLYRKLRGSPVLTRTIMNMVEDKDDFIAAAIEIHGRAHFLASELVEHRFGKHYMYRVEV